MTCNKVKQQKYFAPLQRQEKWSSIKKKNPIPLSLFSNIYVLVFELAAVVSFFAYSVSN
jgi:hypothetical protein